MNALLCFFLFCLLSASAHSFQRNYQGTKLAPQLEELENVIQSFKQPNQQAPKKKRVLKSKVPDFAKNPYILLNKQKNQAKNPYEDKLFF